jgi:hypothetical protein
LLLEPGLLSITAAGNDKVVHVAGDDKQVLIAPSNVDTGIRNAPAEAKREKESVEILIPQEGALLQTLQAMQELADHPRRGVDATGDSHVHRLRELGVQKSSLDVHLGEIKVLSSCNRQQSAE